MGYELFATRREDVLEHGSEIAVEEWLSLVESDPELELVPDMGPYFARFLGPCKYGEGNGWFDWSDGNVFTKYPDEVLLSKLLQISRNLGGRVAGEENETYTDSSFKSGVEMSSPQAAPRLGFIERLRSLFSFLDAYDETVLPFEEGDRVADSWGHEGTVKKIDRRAEHGLGRITVIYDDGREAVEAVVTQGFRPVD